jgi:hypothetical protein
MTFGSDLPKVSLEVQPCHCASVSLLDVLTFVLLGRDSALFTFRRRPRHPHRRWALALTRIVRWWYLDIPTRTRHGLILARRWTNSVDQGLAPSLFFFLSFFLSLRLRSPLPYLWLSICTAATGRLKSNPRGAARSQWPASLLRSLPRLSHSNRTGGIKRQSRVDKPVSSPWLVLIALSTTALHRSLRALAA